MKNGFKVFRKVAFVLIINIVFCANRYAYSDGFNKTNFQKANINLNDIAYNGKSTYVSVGKDGEIEVSKDGIHLKPVKVPSITCNLTKIKWTGTQFITISDEGMIFSSKDGYKWTKGKGIRLGKINNFIEYQGCIVLIGDKGKIYTSKKGLSFTTVKSNTTESLNDIIRTTTEFVAVGNKGTIVISKDGKTWAKVKSGVTQNLMDISWNGKKYVTVGGDAILSSSDSKKWLVKHFNNKSKKVNLNLTKIAWNKKEMIVAGVATISVGNGFKNRNSFVFFKSTDGIHWYGHVVEHKLYNIPEKDSWFTDVSLLDLISANGKFIVFGHDDATDWSEWYEGTPMLIGYLDEIIPNPNTGTDLLDNYWSIDFWKSTSDEKRGSTDGRWGSFKGETMRKALWDGKSVTVVGDTILRYNDANGNSYIRKGRPEDQFARYMMYNGNINIDYINSLYSKDKEYWTYDEKYSVNIRIDNIDRTLHGNRDDTPIVWTGKVAIAIAEDESLEYIDDIVAYSYDGAKWFDTKIHGCFSVIYKQNNKYIAESVKYSVSENLMAYEIYVSTDGINWVKEK